jgi:hypothetical protein
VGALGRARFEAEREGVAVGIGGGVGMDEGDVGGGEEIWDWIEDRRAVFGQERPG